MVGVAVQVDGRLDVLVAELLLNEVDRLTRGEPERRGGVSKVVEPDGARKGGVAQCDVVAASTGVVAVELASGGAREDERTDSALTGLVGALVAQDVKQAGDNDVARLVTLRCAGAADLTVLEIARVPASHETSRHPSATATPIRSPAPMSV